MKNQSKKLIIEISSNPCANSAYEVAKLINGYSKTYYARYIMCWTYGTCYKEIPFRAFPHDLKWGDSKEECIGLLKTADIIHIHSSIPEEMVSYINPNAKVVWTVYNINSSLKVANTEENQKYYKFIKEHANLVTVVDQPMQKQIYTYLGETTLPLVKYLFNETITRNNKIPVIIFAPTNTHPLLSGNASTKGYDFIIAVIEKLKKKHLKFEFDLIMGVPYEENLERKRKADIIIDDVVHETFHNTSLEGALFESVILTNYSDKEYPFFKTSLVNLEDHLIKLIRNPKLRMKERDKIIKWKKKIYTPEKLLERFEKVYNKVLTIESLKFIPNEQKIVPLITPIISTVQQSSFKVEEITIKSIVKKLKNSLLFFILIKDSCLDATLFNIPKINTQKLFIAVDNIEIMEKINNILSVEELKKIEIDIHKFNKYKVRNYCDIECYVPLPVVTYLEEYYNKSYAELEKLKETL